jgi:hypothetical protein
LEIYGLCTAGYAECAQFSYAFALDNKFWPKRSFWNAIRDDYVDMVGMDNHADFGRNDERDVESGIKKVEDCLWLRP